MATINELLSQLQTDKNNLVANLVAKGVEASSSETFTSLVPKVLAIFTGVDTSDATALAADIAIGKTAYVNGKKITGTQEVIWSNGVVSGAVTSVKIPNGVTSIGDSAFLFCDSLKSITIPDSVTSIGDHAFEHCDILKTVKIPNGVTSIGRSAFYGCMSLTNITIPDSVTSIGDRAFYNCTSLTNIYYKGTEEQWNAITKGTDWNTNMGSDVEGGTVITYNYAG